MIERALNFLIRFKNDLKGIETVEDIDDTSELDQDEAQDEAQDEPEDYDDYDEDADPDPLTWAELKNVRKELRRFLTWHALRMKVPKAWESPK